MTLSADNVYRSTRFQTGEDLDKALAAALAASETDLTLSVKGKAADAKATGEALDSKVNKSGDTTGWLRLLNKTNNYGIFLNPVSSLDTGYMPKSYDASQPTTLATTSKGEFFIQLPCIDVDSEDDFGNTEYEIVTCQSNAAIILASDGLFFLPAKATRSTPKTEFLRTDTIVDWAINNTDTWTPFFGTFHVGRVQQKSYTGTGVYGEANKKTITFDFQPKLIIVKKRDSLLTNSDGTEKTKDFNEVMMMAFYDSPSAVSSRYFGTGTVYSYQTHLGWSGKSVSWWGQSETRHLNIKNNTYHVLAIG